MAAMALAQNPAPLPLPVVACFFGRPLTQDRPKRCCIPSTKAALPNGRPAYVRRRNASGVSPQ